MPSLPKHSQSELCDKYPVGIKNQGWQETNSQHVYPSIGREEENTLSICHTLFITLSIALKH